MIHVLYHSNCYDGFGSAWAAWRKLGDGGVTYRAVNYGDPLPQSGIADDDCVFLLDFSWPADRLERLARRGIQIQVLDHHKSAGADLRDLVGRDDLPNLKILFDVEKSGAVLAWEHFHPGTSIPMMLQYVQDRDLWAWRLEDSQQVAAWMRSWPMELARWSGIALEMEDWENLLRIRAEGSAILRFQSRQVEIMADNAIMLTLGGYEVHAANATCFFSEVGEELCKRFPDEPFAGYWLDRKDGKRQWGLRSRGGFDCTTVAKQYSGGGHPGAAGFTTDSKWCGGW